MDQPRPTCAYAELFPSRLHPKNGGRTGYRMPDVTARRSAGQLDGKCRTPMLLTRHFDRAAMLLNDLMHNGKTQSCAFPFSTFVFGGKKRIKNVF